MQVNLSWRNEASQVPKQSPCPKEKPKHQNDVVAFFAWLYFVGPRGWFFVNYDMKNNWTLCLIIILIVLLYNGSISLQWFHFCNWKIIKYPIEILNAIVINFTKSHTQRKPQSTHPHFAMTNFSKPCAFDSG